MLIHKLLSIVGKILSKNKLNILIYHQVFAEKNAMRPSEPDAAEFKWQMQLINQYFTPLSLSAALKHLDNNTLPANAICITFDDGYINNLEVAAPILKKIDIPATVYIATGFSCGENMFNDRVIDLVGNEDLSILQLQAIDEDAIKLSNIEQRIKAAHHVLAKIKYLPIASRKKVIDTLYQDNSASESAAKMMTDEQIMLLYQNGMEIGGHTVSHPIMAKTPGKQLIKEVKDNKLALENLLNTPIRFFAYPNGKPLLDYLPEQVQMISDKGYQAAVSTQWGVADNNSDFFQLPRFTPWDKNSIKFMGRMILMYLRNE